MFPFVRILTLIPLAMLLGACVQIPSLPAPQASQALPLPPRYDASSYPTPELTDSLFRVFGSAQLPSVTRRALTNNPDLVAAGSRLDEAGFNLKQTRASLFPSVDGSASGNRSLTNGAFANARSVLSVGLDASWELDVWGRIKNGVAAASSDQAAAAADLASARQSIAAQTMQAWFAVVATNQLLDLAQRQSDSLSQTVALTERRFERGTATLAELELARSDATNALADIQESLENRDSAARALKVLMGDYPDTELAGANTWPSLRRSVPAGVPSSLLRDRPDLDAAFHRIRAADSRVKVAHADLFPSFSLTSGVGRSSSTLRNLVEASANTWSIGANVLTPIFDAGSRRAELGAANERAKQAYQSYRSIALVAFQEVENALSAEERLRREQLERDAALKAAKNAESRSRRDFEVGISDLLSLLETQQRVFVTEQQTITVRADRYNNRVALAVALGKAF